jgi:hypothetical protein
MYVYQLKYYALSILIFLTLPFLSLFDLNNIFLTSNIILLGIPFIYMFLLKYRLIIIKYPQYLGVIFFLSSITGLMNYNGIQSFFPSIFWFAFIIYLIFFNTMTRVMSNRTLVALRVTASIIIIISILSFFIDYSGGRFNSITPSSTTFSLMLLLLFVIILNTRRLKYDIYLLIFLFLFILLSGTRSSIMFLVVTGFYKLNILPAVIKRSNSVKIVIFLLLMLIYFILAFINESNNDYLDVLRRDGQDVDYSLITRISLFKLQLLKISNLSFHKLIFGAGFNSLRDSMGYLSGNNLVQPHNDFFRIIYDGGLIYSILIMIYFIKLALKTDLLFLIILVYFISFYHNMIYYMPFAVFVAFIIAYETTINNNTRLHVIKKLRGS